MIQFNTGKAELVLLDLPKDADRFLVFNDVEPYLSYWQSVRTMRYYLPHKAYYEVIARASDVTEDVAATLFHISSRHNGNFYHWDDKAESGQWYCHPEYALQAIARIHNLDNPVILKRK